MSFFKKTKRNITIFFSQNRGQLITIDTRVSITTRDNKFCDVLALRFDIDQSRNIKHSKFVSFLYFLKCLLMVRFSKFKVLQTAYNVLYMNIDSWYLKKTDGGSGGQLASTGNRWGLRWVAGIYRRQVGPQIR